MQLHAPPVIRAPLGEVATFSALHLPRSEPIHRNLRAVVLEDSALLLRYYLIMLSRVHGLDVVNRHPVETLEQALAVIEQAKPNVVITDLCLSLTGVEGFDILKEVRARYPGMPVILTTAIYSPDNHDALNERIRTEGFDAVFHKILGMPYLEMYLVRLMHGNVNQ